MRKILMVGAATLLAGCGTGGHTDETAVDDTGDSADTGDTEDTEISLPLEGWGAIAGACNVLDEEEWGTRNPYFFKNAITFTGAFDSDALSPGGQEVIADGNLGGSSLNSEAMSFEMLYRCELAELIATEAEITYDDTGGKKTDLLVSLDARKIGVSVTRAVGWPRDDPYTLEQADGLLEKKLDDILLSSANVSEADAWERQILSVLAYADEHVQRLEEAWTALDAGTRADTIVVVTATHGEDLFIYE